MVGGTTGESVSFDFYERLETIMQYLDLAQEYDFDVYVHVGMNSVHEAAKLAKAAAELTGKGGAIVKGILSMAPTYFRPSNVEDLIETMAVVANGAPELPFWYYHFPDMTKVDLDMFAFVKAADESGKIPNLMGVKFTNEMLMAFNQIGNFKDKKYNMLMGRDEILTSALATGVCDGAVGSTMNFISFNLDLAALYSTWSKDDKELADEN
jgi:N-acetylneuraminate lyase